MLLIKVPPRTDSVTITDVNGNTIPMVNVSTNVLSLSVLLDKVYLVKVPYTAFAIAKDTDTQNFLAGLEEKYGIQGLGTTEKKIFDKLNGITSGEANIFAQAVDEMKGFVYSNIQQRTKEKSKQWLK